MSLRTALKALFGTAWHVQGDSIIDGMTPAADGTVESGKPVVPTGADKTIDAIDITALKIGGTALASTPAALDAASTAYANGILGAAASTAASLPNSGVSRIDSTGGTNLTFTLAAPTTGVRKTIVQAGNSTSSIVACSTGVGILTTGAGAAGSTSATFAARGQALSLIGLSAALWGIVGSNGSPTFTT